QNSKLKTTTRPPPYASASRQFLCLSALLARERAADPDLPAVPGGRDAAATGIGRGALGGGGAEPGAGGGWPRPEPGSAVDAVGLPDPVRGRAARPRLRIESGSAAAAGAVGPLRRPARKPSRTTHHDQTHRARSSTL